MSDTLKFSAGNPVRYVGDRLHFHTGKYGRIKEAIPARYDDPPYYRVTLDDGNEIGVYEPNLELDHNPEKEE